MVRRPPVVAILQGGQEARPPLRRSPREPTMLFDSLVRLQENAGRLREILTVMGKYGLAGWLSRIRITWMRKWLRTAEGRSVCSS